MTWFGGWLLACDPSVADRASGARADPESDADTDTDADADADTDADADADTGAPVPPEYACFGEATYWLDGAARDGLGYVGLEDAAPYRVLTSRYTSGASQVEQVNHWDEGGLSDATWTYDFGDGFGYAWGETYASGRVLTQWSDEDLDQVADTSWTYTYDPDGRLLTVALDGAQYPIETWAYDGAGALVEIVYRLGDATVIARATVTHPPDAEVRALDRGDDGVVDQIETRSAGATSDGALTWALTTVDTDADGDVDQELSWAWADGRVVQREERHGADRMVDAYTYDGLGRLIDQLTTVSGSTASTSEVVWVYGGTCP